MNQNDRQLIVNLSERLKQAQPVEKDPEASQMITQQIANQPDALYLLTQAVLLQEQAIRNLQQQVNELQTMKPKRGFFSSLLGGSNNNASYPNSQGAAYQPRNTFGSGSFLGSALSTAAGVAGGMFLFEGLHHLFSSPSVASDSFVSNSLMGDPLQGQSGLLDDGFGTGDNFMDDTSFSDGGDWGDGFGDNF